MSRALALWLTLAGCGDGGLPDGGTFATDGATDGAANAKDAAMDGSPLRRPAHIGDILGTCPTNDPLYAQLRADFEIRVETVPIGAIACSEPVSALPIAQYTNELIILQTLRTIYYMEDGRSVAYPWTPMSLYDWLKSKIGGVDLRANNANCCESFNGKWYPSLELLGDLARSGARQWIGIADRIGVLTHEARHVDGFPHVGGCPLFPTLGYGCDQRYDEGNLSTYGIQRWLNAKWLSGELNVGFACLAPSDVSRIASAHRWNTNDDYGKRFVDNAPPVVALPSQPGGPCL